ncbi:hypothetical protein BDF19DRAFT_73748 [Syncephalis fuscata]|nr:hypothetical protein BDF19DRAFT_73748 [Syncephalis fuscata]
MAAIALPSPTSSDDHMDMHTVPNILLSTNNATNEDSDASSNSGSEHSVDSTLLSSEHSVSTSTSTSLSTSPTKDMTLDSAIAQVSAITATASAPLTSIKTDASMVTAVATNSPPKSTKTEAKSPNNGHERSKSIPTTSTTQPMDDKNMHKIWHLTGQLSSFLSRNQRNLDDLRRRADQCMVRSRQPSVVHINGSIGSGSVGGSNQTTVMANNLQHTESAFIPTPAEINQLQMENTRLRQRNCLLEDETRELTSIVKEHERALETIMDRFRAQTFNMLWVKCDVLILVLF